jgi:peptide/nickel transport system ATP-binding protein
MVSLNPALTVGFQMMEALRLHHRLPAEEARKRSLEMLERVKILDPAGCFRAYPHQYSGGMRQRIMLASVLVMRPKLLIADEPTTALDALIQKEVMDIMAALTRDIGTAVLLVSHDLGMVANYADQVVMLRQGKVVEFGDDRGHPARAEARVHADALESLPERKAQETGGRRQGNPRGNRERVGGFKEEGRGSSGSGRRSSARWTRRASRSHRARRSPWWANRARARPRSAARWCASLRKARGRSASRDAR